MSNHVSGRRKSYSLLFSLGIRHHNMLPALVAVAFVTCLVVSSARADSVTVAPASTNSPTVTEGNSLTWTYNVTITDTDNHTLQKLPGDGADLNFVSGDPSDFADDLSTNYFAFAFNDTCQMFYTSSATCSFQVLVPTPSPANDSDVDSGTFSSQVNQTWVDVTGFSHFQVTSFTSGYQVLDPVPTTPTPEPSSLLLLGAGLVGMVGIALRRKQLA